MERLLELLGLVVRGELDPCHLALANPGVDWSDLFWSHDGGTKSCPIRRSDAQVLADVAAERGAGKVVVRAEVGLPDSCPKSISAESPTRIDRHALAIPGVDAECGWDVSFRQVGGTTSRPCVDELPQPTSWHDEHLATH